MFDAALNPLAYNSADLNTRMDLLLTKITEAYKPVAHWNKIQTTSQQINETVLQFYTRMKRVFDQNSGVPYDAGDKSPYSHQLKNAFLLGLDPEIRRFVQKHMLGWEIEAFDKVRFYAEHAEKVSK